MNTKESNMFYEIVNLAGKLLARVNKLQGYIEAREDSQELIRKQFRLVTQADIDNKISTSSATTNKKEVADDMIVKEKITGLSLDSKPRPDGRWQARYKENGKWKSVYRHTSKEAFEEAKRRLETISEANVKYSVWLAEWFERYKKPNIGSKWASTMLGYIKRISEELGSYKIESLTTEAIQDYLTGIEEDNTRNKIKTIINESLRKAVNLRKLTHNPCGGVEIKRGKPQKRQPIDVPDQDLVFDTISNPTYKKLFQFCCCTGLRISEALGANHEDIKNGMLTVDKQYTRDNELEYRVKSDAGYRAVPILPELQKALGKGKGRIFEGVTYNSASLFFYKLYKKLNIKVTVTHSMRHTFISNCYRAGINIKLIQMWAGHAKADLTLNTYTHLMSKGTSKFLDYACKLKQNFDTQFDTQTRK